MVLNVKLGIKMYKKVLKMSTQMVLNLKFGIIMYKKYENVLNIVPVIRAIQKKIKVLHCIYAFTYDRLNDLLGEFWIFQSKNLRKVLNTVLLEI